jgi:mannitol operon transcriptional antiterminator
MIDLSARQKFILNSIIEKGPLNVKDLSQQIDVSSRTVSREIAVINNILADKDIAILENYSSLSIKGSSDAVKSVQQLLGGIPLQWLLSQDQRILLIIAQLLVAAEPYKSAYFSYQFNVVEGTISLYMDKIEQWLNIQNLTLSKKRGYGILVEGPEWTKRNSFIELLYEYKPIDELLEFVYGNKTDPTISAFFRIVFDEELIGLSKEILELIKSDMVARDDMAYFNSFIYIMLSLKKTKLGVPIKLPAYLVQDVLSANEFSFTNKIKGYLSSKNIALAEDELAYTAIQLMANKYVYNSNRTFKELGVPLEDLASEVVYEVSKKLNISIDCDEQLILGLSQHFNPALYRINMGIQIKNPLTNQIREYYGELFNAVNYASRLVFSKYNITMPQDEIGYITMHIGAAMERGSAHNKQLSALVICPSGIGTAKILSNKIKQSFPNIASVKIANLKDWNESDGSYDIILSTVKIDQKSSGKNIIMVSPFLQQTDMDKINDFINKYDSKPNLMNNFRALLRLDDQKVTESKYDLVNNLLENLQLEMVEADSFEELAAYITGDLSVKKLITDEDEVKTLLINREEMGSVVIPNSHVALLHTRSDSVANPFVGAYRLKGGMVMKSIGFEDENVDTFIVMLARKNEDSYILEQLGKISISLIEDKQFTEALRLGDIKDLRSALVKILNEEAI